MIPEQQCQPSSGPSGQESNHQDADPLLGDAFAEHQAAGGEADHQQQVAPSRHDPALVKRAVALIDQVGQPVGMDLHPGNGEQALAALEAGVGHFEQIPQRCGGAADQHDSVLEHGLGHRAIQDISE